MPFIFCADETDGHGVVKSIAIILADGRVSFPSDDGEIKSLDSGACRCRGRGGRGIDRFTLRPRTH